MDFKTMLNKALDEGTATLGEIMNQILEAADTIQQEKKGMDKRKKILDSLEDGFNIAIDRGVFTTDDVAALTAIVISQDSKIGRTWDADRIDDFFVFMKKLLGSIDSIYDESYRESVKDEEGKAEHLNIANKVLKEMANKRKETGGTDRKTEQSECQMKSKETDRKTCGSCVSCSTKKTPTSKSGSMRINIPRSGIFPDEDIAKVEDFFKDIFG